MKAEDAIKKLNFPKIIDINSFGSSNSKLDSVINREGFKHSAPKFLIIERDNLKQRVYSNEIIHWLLFKLHNLKSNSKKKSKQRLARFENNLKFEYSQQNIQYVTDDIYSGVIRHVAIPWRRSEDFKNKNRKVYIDALKWIC